MSHFSVMVVGENIEEQLQPYHEFECTGINDEYIKDIDVTEEYRSEYESQTKTFYADKNGVKYEYYDDSFYREPTPDEAQKNETRSTLKDGLSWTKQDWNDGLGHRVKIHCIPKGFTEIKINRKDLESFKTFCEEYNSIEFVSQGKDPDLEGDHKYGYGILNESDEVIKVIRRTNPNAKWDYWRVGGRWRGALKLKTGKSGEYGDVAWEMAEKADTDMHCDLTLKGHIDIEAMEAPMRERATITWDEWHSKIKYLKDDDEEKSLWIRDKMGFFVSKNEIDQLTSMPREEYIECQSLWTPYSIVWESKWYSEGKMGWFGISSKNESNWSGQFKEFWAQIPDDAVITMVDCHI